MDDKLLAFSALLYRCLTNKAALQRMLDCGCLERFVTDHSAAGRGADKGKPSLTVNTAQHSSAHVKVDAADWEDVKKKRKSPAAAASAASPKSAKKVKAEKPPKPQPQPSPSAAAATAAKRRKAGTASPSPSDSALTPCSSPSALSSVPALVRSNTMPAANASIMNSPMAYTEGQATPAAASPSIVAALPSPRAAPSPRKPAVKATARRSPMVKSEKAAKRTPIKTNAVTAAPSVSAPNTPLSSRVLDLSSHRPQARVTPATAARTPKSTAAAARAGSPALREPQSPSSHSGASVFSTVSSSTASSVFSGSGVESALSPSLHFSSHHPDALLPALSLPSAFPEVTLHGVMEELPADDDVYRHGYGGGRARQAKPELVDDLPQGGYRYRPRTLSESHPSHPLHSLQDASAFPHDFLVHEPPTAAAGDEAAAPTSAPLSPQSYHSGDSMDTEHSSPMPDLEAMDGHAKPSSSAPQPQHSDAQDTAWLNLDHMDSPFQPILEMPVS